MKFLKSHFALSRSQQNGIFVLVILIILVQILIYTYDNFNVDSKEEIPETEIQAYQQQLDSLRKTEVKNLTKKDTIYPFNPNYLTDFKGYQIGMSVEEIDRLLEYRKTGKWVNSASDFQKVSGISDSLLKKIAPFFRFPEWTQKLNTELVHSEKKLRNTSGIIDLNAATAEDLRSVNGVGEVLSNRIVKYRLSIGGFLSPIQLKDVYGLSPEVIERINARFQIITKPDIQIRNINSINESELAEIPYFKADLARKIIGYRNLNERISSFEELAKINGFPSDKIDRIELYLTVK
ncbi:MAG: helix-hairpin-helix domain-containing protein [Christiangramia sp.]